MKKYVVMFSSIAASFVMATSAFANVELYSLDGRTLSVADDEVALYTAEGMGWYAEKPITMYSLDGRTLIVPADCVEAHQKVGWYLEKDLPQSADADTSDGEDDVIVVPDTMILIKYIDGTIVKVPSEHLSAYEELGWTEATEEDLNNKTVVIYDKNGNSKEVPAGEVEKYEKEGWSTVKPSGKPMTVYFHDKSEKQILDSEYENYKSQGWFATYEEAVYNYAVNGDGADVIGATELLKNKKYEFSYNMVRDALDKIENSGSEYVEMLYDIRTEIMSTWNAAAKSPLGFINYWFAEKDDKDIIVFEYRNVGNNRIKGFKLSFEVCDANGNVIEERENPYNIDNLQMAPCDKKRVAWVISNGDAAKSIKNLKVREVTYADGTKWTAEN